MWRCGAEACAAAFATAARQQSARRLLFERDLGVCAQCGLDAHGLFKRLQALPTEGERLQLLMSSSFWTLTDRLRRMLTAPKEGDFWEADHVVAVADGGGESSLDNFQTLCVPCHAKKTKADGARKRRAELAVGSADLRTFFDAEG